MPGYMKLLLVCGIIFLAVKFHQQFLNYLISSSDLTKKMMTKYEIDELEHQIFLDFTANNLPIPSKNEFGWRDYIREKIKTKTIFPVIHLSIYGVLPIRSDHHLRFRSTCLPG
jgi:hypothetical protein